MKKYFLIGGLILSNIVFILLYVGTLTTQNEQETTTDKEESKQEVESVMSTQQPSKTETTNKKNKDLHAGQDKIGFIKEVFTTLFDYTNEDYQSRFEVAEGMVKESILQNIQGMMGADVPKIKFQNKVNGVKVYITPFSSQSITDALVYVTSSYKIEGSEASKRNQLFRIDIEEKNGGYLITNLESYGFINPLSQS